MGLYKIPFLLLMSFELISCAFQIDNQAFINAGDFGFPPNTYASEFLLCLALSEQDENRWQPQPMAESRCRAQRLIQ